MSYTKESLLKLHDEQIALEQYIGDIAEKIAIIRGNNTRRWSFSGYEFEYPDSIIQSYIHYYSEHEGEHRHNETWNLWEDNIKKWEESKQPSHITAKFYLGYECEYTSITFPIKYLYSDEWETIEQEKIDTQKLKEQEIKAQATKDREIREREQYEKLRAKFGGEQK